MLLGRRHQQFFDFLCYLHSRHIVAAMATARLRRAFRYPDDSGDDEHSREELDEEGMYILANGQAGSHSRRRC